MAIFEGDRFYLVPYLEIDTDAPYVDKKVQITCLDGGEVVGLLQSYGLCDAGDDLTLEVQISSYGYMGVCSIPATDIEVFKVLEP
ncbi:hypothetical protein NHP200010_06920 [Helicobacter bizzozeronii]|uniref:hypothetical protein n=1 Tax=Helicobacter bizzozeronii TaxID=56877 RepID=UPI00244D90FC|nr:hypothetical protein [Helicobacter bizzozeronii]GMB92981.1 hypothetical protein NHP200010_06920 [Helicobacter bizzozeronii]